MTKEYWAENYNKVLKQIKEYEESKLSLTKQDVSLLYKEKSFWHNKCEHWDKQTKEEVVNWTDSGYGLDRHYSDIYRITRCPDCKEKLDEVYVRSANGYGSW